jgi:outer membrane receptor protein involved in Fe transport
MNDAALLRVQHLTSVALLAGLFARPAVAAADAEGSSSGANDNILQEVVVTASKRSESLQEVPTAVTALTGSERIKRTAAGAEGSFFLDEENRQCVIPGNGGCIP